MKRLSSILVALCAACVCAFAQAPTWFCSQTGTKLTYEKKDAKGAASGPGFQYIITGCKSEGAKTVVSFDVVVPGLANTTGCSVWTEGGLFHTDAAASLGQFNGELAAEGNSPVLPENPVIGEELAECNVTISSLMLSCDYSKIKFTKQESITVPAGTFDCWCLEYDTTAKVMGLKAQNHTQQWIAKGIGDVKVVVSDKRGRVVSSQELVKIEK